VVPNQSKKPAFAPKGIPAIRETIIKKE